MNNLTQTKITLTHYDAVKIGAEWSTTNMNSAASSHHFFPSDYFHEISDESIMKLAQVEDVDIIRNEKDAIWRFYDKISGRPLKKMCIDFIEG